MAHTKSERIMVVTNPVPKRVGTFIHTNKKRAFTNIPRGTTDIARSNSDPDDMLYIPIAAGTIVVGTVARTPPVLPPNFSIATVTNVATTPAKKAESRTEATNISLKRINVDNLLNVDSRIATLSGIISGFHQHSANPSEGH